MAAHLEGKGATVLDFTGFAQKFGPVLSYVRLGREPGGDQPGADRCRRRRRGDRLRRRRLLLAEGLGTYRPGTRIVLNRAEMPTGDIVRFRDADLAVDAREAAIDAAVGRENLRAFDANAVAERLFGDSVFANVMMLGFAWQSGLVPVGLAALARAIELNGVAVAENEAAFAARAPARRPIRRRWTRRSRWRSPRRSTR